MACKILFNFSTLFLKLEITFFSLCSFLLFFLIFTFSNFSNTAISLKEGTTLFLKISALAKKKLCGGENGDVLLSEIPQSFSSSVGVVAVLIISALEATSGVLKTL